MALGLTLPLTEMSTRNISWWGKQPYHLHVPNVFKSGSLNLLQPSGPVQVYNGIALSFILLTFLKSHANLRLILHSAVVTELKFPDIFWRNVGEGGGQGELTRLYSETSQKILISLQTV